MSISQKSKDFPDCFYRVTVKALVVKGGKILLVKESSELGGQYEVPGGGLDFGEEIHEGLRREVEEEMGVKVKNIGAQPTYVWTWKYENKRGMDWYYSLVLGYQVELESYDFKPSFECEEVGWFTKEELVDIGLSWQTNGLKKVFDPGDFN